jgi:hypothetical protein
MTSTLDVLLGQQEPTLLVTPAGVVSLADADEASELADLAGLVLDNSQVITLRAALGTSSVGRWAAPTVADIEPRQNGKGDTIIARQLHGLFNLAEPLQIYTAHEFPTANEMFLRLVGLIEGSDWLRRRVARVRYANGEQGVELRNGCRLKYRARTGGSGRGFAGATTVYYDESLYVTDAHLAASLPALSTARKHSVRGGQLWYASSGLLATSAVMWRMRLAAIDGTLSESAWVEHTAEFATVDGLVVRVEVDPDDRAAWARANSALGYRIPVDHLVMERANMSPEVFARERLGVCDPLLGAESGPWPDEVWAAVQQADATPDGARVLGVDATPAEAGPQRCSVVGGAANGVLELVGQPAPGELAAEVVRLATTHRCPVALDRSGPAAFILPALEAAGVVVVDVSGRAMFQACAEFDTAVRAGTPRVRTHAALGAAVRAARHQVTGDVWRWARRGLADDVSPLVALTCAWWALRQPPERQTFDLFL